MPRIQPRDYFHAAAINKAVSRLLPICRDLPSARNEFRWLQEHAITVSQKFGLNDHTAILRGFVQRRAHGEPLQYLLGSVYFGSLEIKCRPGVLIPRPETAASVTHLVELLPENDTASPSPLRVLDLCTGSGCIPLLFHHEYYKNGRRTNPVELVGIDLSSEALSLARENLIYQIAAAGKNSNKVPQATASLQGTGFVQANVLAREDNHSVSEALRCLSSDANKFLFDVMISNPPYISPKEFRTTSRSVRKHEPRLALVPPVYKDTLDSATADLFYPKLLDIAEQVKAKVALLEVSNTDQAKRVISVAMGQKYWNGMEIWRDFPSGCDDAASTTLSNDQSVRLRGCGHGRSVFLYRDEAKAWLKFPS